jgi:hypothetical protein
VPGKLFFMEGFHEGDPCTGQIKEKRKMANRIPDRTAAKPQPKRNWLIREITYYK